MKIILKILLVLLLVTIWTGTRAQSGKPFTEVTALRVEYTENPLGTDIQKPRFSWEIRANVRNVAQIAYDIRVAATPENLRSGNNLIWTTKKVMSDRNNQIEYTGPAPKAGERFYWTVRIWDNQYRITDWAKPAFWEAGLTGPDSWQASWIEPGNESHKGINETSPYFRKEFSVNKRVKSARLYITSHGLYQVEINGIRPNDWVLTPGWTSYNKHLQYQTYDVTELLNTGRNAIGVILGNGWYLGQLGWEAGRSKYGKQLGLLAQLNITYRDGSTERVVSDETWRFTPGPILMSEIYHGETYDARLEKSGWSTARFDDSGWNPAVKQNFDNKNLVAQYSPPVRPTAELRPIAIFSAPNGDTVVDMGQNMVGWIRLKVSGKAGTRIILKHAEVLDKAGNMYYDNLRVARQTVEYILKGAPKEVYEPHFTFQGFRFVKVSGFPGELRKENITGIVVHSDMEPAGEFVCSDSLLTQLQHNIQWGLRGNFVDVPTDCPQRDERLGWTGDAQVFAPTACYNYNAATFYTKWLKDVAFDQLPDGRLPHVIPDVLGDGGSTGWADASVIVPWTLYQQYGDLRILAEQYTSMKAWIDYMKKQAGDKYLWTNGSHFGDWLAFATTRSDYPGATTDKDLIATAYFAWSTRLFSKMAELLGKTDDAQNYRELFGKIREAFNREYVTPNGRLASNTQTAYAIALKFGLVPDEQRVSVAARFAADVSSFGHITTGFLGASLVNPLLSDFGYDDLAYKLLMRKDYPSWLYPVTRGATTIWERWDGIRPDGSFQDPGMNSFNHYAYGAIGSWMYSQIAGLQADESVPAYKKIRIHPVIGGGLTYARAEHFSLYGKIASEWRIANNKLTLYVTIPPNSSAEVFVKTSKPDSVTESGRPVKDATDVRFLRLDKGYAVYQIGSGKYTFESDYQ